MNQHKLSNEDTESGMLLLYREVDFNLTPTDYMGGSLDFSRTTKALIHSSMKVSLTDDQRLVIDSEYHNYAYENKIYLAEHWLVTKHPKLKYFSIVDNELIPFEEDIIEGYKKL